MKKNRFHYLLLLITCFILFGCLPLSGKAQENKPIADTALYKEILHMDSVLFDAFNAHKVDIIAGVFDEDLEFYHDKGGLSFYKENIAAMKSNFDKSNDLKRELVPGSLEVYPVKGYGAIQFGLHRFCHTENGKPDCGTFKFLHIWQKKEGKWKLTRVISYDH